MKRIVVDCRPITKSTGGIAHFFIPLLEEMINCNKYELILVAPHGNGYLERYRERAKVYYVSDYTNQGFVKKIYNDLCYYPCELSKHEADLLISPYYDFKIPMKLFNKAVITIHDLCYWELVDIYPIKTRAYYQLLGKWNSLVAKKVMTVSETSRKKIERVLGIPDEKSSVVFNSYEASLAQGKNTETFSFMTEGTTYFGYTSGIDERKNVEMLLKSFNQFSNESEADIKLVITCGKRRDYVLDMIKNMNLKAENFVLLDYISLEEMDYLYRMLSGVVNLSLYEGFGRSNLEAMNYGLPLLASKIEIFEEVCGDYPIYVENNSMDEIIEGFKKLSQEGKREVELPKQFSLKDNISTFMQMVENL